MKIKLVSVILVIILLWAVYSVIDFLFLNKYKPGNCIQSEDSYIWHINNYHYGKYSMMGWQKSTNAWGNEIKLNKDIVEREQYPSKIPTYYLATCPVFGNN